MAVVKRPRELRYIAFNVSQQEDLVRSADTKKKLKTLELLILTRMQRKAVSDSLKELLNRQL